MWNEKSLQCSEWLFAKGQWIRKEADNNEIINQSNEGFKWNERKFDLKYANEAK